MFQSHNPAAVEQLQRIAQRLEKQILYAEANDPNLARLNQSEREAASKIDSSLPDDESKTLIKAHDRTVWTLVHYISHN